MNEGEGYQDRQYVEGSPETWLKTPKSERASHEYPIERRLNFVVIGHVDSGKSSLCVRLLFETGEYEKRKYFARLADDKTKNFSLASFNDESVAERHSGITIFSKSKVLRLNEVYVNLVDCPGHQQFIKNMCTGAVQCEFAMVTLAVDTFEVIVDSTVMSHCLIANFYGAKDILVCVSKMDIPSGKEGASFSEDRFNEAIASFKQNLMVKCGYEADRITAIPVSVERNVNILTRSELTPWYTGPSVIEYIESRRSTATKSLMEKPLRFFPSGKASSPKYGAILTGNVCSGILKPNSTLKVVPIDETFQISTIQMHRLTVNEGEPGMNVGLKLRQNTVLGKYFFKMKKNTSSLIPGRLVTYADSDGILAGTEFDAIIKRVRPVGVINVGAEYKMYMLSAPVIVKIIKVYNFSKIITRKGKTYEVVRKSKKPTYEELKNDTDMNQYINVRLATVPIGGGIKILADLDLPSLKNIVLFDGYTPLCTGTIKKVHPLSESLKEPIKIEKVKEEE